MSQIVGVDLHPTDETSLANMIDLGLSRYLEQYEQIFIGFLMQFIQFCLQTRQCTTAQYAALNNEAASTCPFQMLAAAIVGYCGWAMHRCQRFV
jgi:hypothetical protein